ncbi:hypothetical protein V6N13_114337 [Hibiscus sabdariffa]|uniref:Sodium/calcium exchanger membrane region domain-containing protein n=1 Tax=Hibiscus sabdariffa TaxID=183260 RepID=A0ABR2U1H6_9ROSI
MPIYLPRRLKIPIACQDRWSKPIAVVSITLAPILLSILWDLQDESAKLGLNFNSVLVVYGIGVVVGTGLRVVAYLKTAKSSPLKSCFLPWLAGGFLMSVIWSYIVAKELVGLLISLGYILEIKYSILGLTVLAWGKC